MRKVLPAVLATVAGTALFICGAGVVGGAVTPVQFLLATVIAGPMLVNSLRSLGVMY